MTHTRTPENPPTTPAQEATARGGFRSLIDIAGGAFFPLAAFARLPLAFLSIGVLTLVTATTGSYATGGLAAAATGVGQAIGGPLSGFIADKTRQRTVLLPASIAHSVLLLALVWGVLTPGVPTWAILLIGFAMGATVPQIGSMSRVRWQQLTVGRPQGVRSLQTALSYESTIDELTFVLGPALVGLIAALFSPWLPMVIAAVLTAILVPLFALHRTAREAEAAHARAQEVDANGSASGPGRWTRRSAAAVAAAVLGMIGLGGVFGTISAGSVAFAGYLGNASIGGLLYSGMGVASALTALSVAAWPASWGQSKRWLVCAGLLVPASLLLLPVQNIWAMIAVLLLIGLPVGPVLVTVYTVGGQAAPAGRLGTVMTLLASGVVVGVSAGNAVAGAVAETAGHQGAFATTTLAAVVLLAAAVLSAILRRRAA